MRTSTVLFGEWQAALRDERTARIVADAVITATNDMAVIAVVRERMAAFNRLTREAYERFESQERREEAAHPEAQDWIHQGDL